MDREKNIRSLVDRSVWDVVVIGGGATGAGCALDAASRGLSVLLLEQHDFGKGTSSRSTKLIHGGIRYLAQGKFSMVRESLAERGHLLRNAPQLVHKQEFIIPCYNLWQKFYYGLGLKIYDLLAGSSNLDHSRFLSRADVLSKQPNIASSGSRGGIGYFDAAFDDTRLLIDILATAANYGAALINYAPVRRLKKDSRGTICGVEFRDEETGIDHSVSAKVVLNAAGVFSDEIRKLDNGDAGSRLTFSQGVHLVFDRSFLSSESAVLIPETSDGRVLFCIPWHGHVLVGTTDTPIETASLEPIALETEIRFILETVAKYLAKIPTSSDILSVFAGIRPLASNDKNSNTASISRGYSVSTENGMVNVTGGKWTTYRAMAEEAVDAAVKVAKFDVGDSTTANIHIVSNGRAVGCDRLHPSFEYTTTDVLAAVRLEMARTVEDVLARRGRMLFVDAAAAIVSARLVGEIIAEELGKDNDWIEQQVKDFTKTAQNYLPKS